MTAALAAPPAESPDVAVDDAEYKLDMHVVESTTRLCHSRPL